MKKLLLLFVLGLIAFLSGVYLYGPATPKSPIGASVEDENIVVINDWFPDFGKEHKGTDLAPTSLSIILVDYDSGEVLVASNARRRLAAASTVKIMTALLALESGDLDAKFTVSKKAAEVGEDTMGLTEGEKVRLADLLYGLMLPSGNDAAIVIAENISGGEDEFVAIMNRKAKELGLSDTKFVNASGLDVDGEIQFSTAHDLSVITRYIWEKYPKFREITSTSEYFVEASETHKSFQLYNQTNLLTTYPGVKGVKPGFTWEAGYCLVTYAENDGKKLIGVVLNSQDRRAEMKQLLDFGFNKLGVKIDHSTLP